MLSEIEGHITQLRRSHSRVVRAIGVVLSFAIGAVLAIGATLCLVVLAVAAALMTSLRWVAERVGGRR